MSPVPFGYFSLLMAIRQTRKKIERYSPNPDLAQGFAMCDLAVSLKTHFGNEQWQLQMPAEKTKQSRTTQLMTVSGESLASADNYLFSKSVKFQRTSRQMPVIAGIATFSTARLPPTEASTN